MTKKSQNNLRKILLVATLGIGFMAFAIVPLISVLQSSSNTPVPENASSSDGKKPELSKEEVIKKIAEIEKQYEEIVKREPKNTIALQKLIDARLKMFQVTGDVEMLKKSQAPLDELIKQYPKNETILAVKKTNRINHQSRR